MRRRRGLGHACVVVAALVALVLAGGDPDTAGAATTGPPPTFQISDTCVPQGTSTDVHVWGRGYAGTLTLTVTNSGPGTASPRSQTVTGPIFEAVVRLGNGGGDHGWTITLSNGNSFISRFVADFPGCHRVTAAVAPCYTTGSAVSLAINGTRFRPFAPYDVYLDHRGGTVAAARTSGTTDGNGGLATTFAFTATPAGAHLVTVYQPGASSSTLGPDGGATADSFVVNVCDPVTTTTRRRGSVITTTTNQPPPVGSDTTTTATTVPPTVAGVASLAVQPSLGRPGEPTTAVGSGLSLIHI